jgi:DNA-binding NarL/FixJ family response regulator
MGITRHIVKRSMSSAVGYRRETLPRITVFLADREQSRRDLCLRLLQAGKGMTVVGQARTTQEAVAGAALKPQIILCDLKMIEGNGVPTLLMIRAKSPRTKIIILTGHASDAQILDAIAQGARGYLGAPLLRPFLLKAVRVVNAGETWVSRAMVSKIIDRLARLSPQNTRPRSA